MTLHVERWIYCDGEGCFKRFPLESYTVVQACEGAGWSIRMEPAAPHEDPWMRRRVHLCRPCDRTREKPLLFAAVATGGEPK